MGTGTEWVLWALFVASAAYSYTGYQKAKKAAQRAAGQRSSIDTARGTLYQTKAAAFPRRLVYGRHRVGGLEVFFGSTGTSNEYLHFILYWCQGPCQLVEKIFFDNEEVTFDGAGLGTGKWAGKVGCEHRKGGTDNLTAIAGAVGAGFGWTSTDKLLGCCYTWIYLKKDDVVFPTGAPSISAIIQGFNNILDERYSLTRYTRNVALCFRHYLCLPRFGPGCDFDEEIGYDEFVDAANICDEVILTSLGGSEVRYGFDAVINLDEEPESIIDSFRTAMAGSAIYVGGRWKMYAGAYIVPTFTITEDMIVGPVRRRTKAPKSSLFNTVKGVYRSEGNKWQPTDFKAYVDEEAKEDDGEELVEDIELLNTRSPTASRRIAKINCKRARLAREIDVTLNVEGLRAQPGLPVYFHFPRMNFDNTVMEVLEYGFSIKENKIFIDLLLRETADTVYDWDPETEDEAANIAHGDETPTASPPVISPNGGTAYTDDVTVSLSCATFESSLFYQIVPLGDPPVFGGYTAYTVPFTVGFDLAGATVWAKANHATLTNSAEVSADFEFEEPPEEDPP